MNHWLVNETHIEGVADFCSPLKCAMEMGHTGAFQDEMVSNGRSENFRRIVAQGTFRRERLDRTTSLNDGLLEQGRPA